MVAQNLRLLMFVVCVLLEVRAWDNQKNFKIECGELQHGTAVNYSTPDLHLIVENCKLNVLNLKNFDVKQITLQGIDATSMSHHAFGQALNKLEVNDCNVVNVEDGALHDAAHLTSLTFQNTNHDLVSRIIAQTTSLTKLEIINSPLSYSIDDNLLAPLRNLINLKLQNNHIQQIPRRAFQGLKNIVSVHISNSSLNLDGGAFDGLENLGVLDLQQIRLGKVPNLELGNLQYLHLSDNVITAIQKKNFGYHLSKLQKLFLANNLLSYLPAATFQNVVSLHWLDLSGNLIHEIDPEAFNGLAKLRHLSLARNNIEYIDNKVFGNLRGLVHLELSHNNITVLHPDLFVNNKRLQNLQWSHNKINSLPNGVFSGLVDLGSLDLQHNEISFIPNDTFEGLINLRYLYLQDNRISEISNNLFTKLRSLVSLWLSKNSLTLLDGASFKGATQLKSLYLDGNEIRSIDRDSFETNSNLATVVLTNNKLEQVDPSIFRKLPKLKTLKLDFNITRKL